MNDKNELIEIEKELDNRETLIEILSFIFIFISLFTMCVYFTFK